MKLVKVRSKEYRLDQSDSGYQITIEHCDYVGDQSVVEYFKEFKDLARATKQFDIITAMEIPVAYQPSLPITN